MMVLSERPVTITAEWALWGKDANDTDYRMLRCSAGTFSPQDFVYAIDRYSPGTLDVRSLPQVTVSWLKNPRTGLPTHVGLAIHETAAADDPRTGSARSRFDAAGREIVYVRFFCVPYDVLADREVSYRQLYHGFQRRTLPADDEPIAADLLMVPEDMVPSTAERQFAVQVAAQLLTTQPVCILGASEISLDRRLRFIDLVMSGLTYGTRSQLSAATSVNSNFTMHKHRLFFASAPRDDPRATFSDALDGAVTRSRRKPDVVVEWGRVDTARARDTDAINYLSWEGLGSRWAPRVLAQDTVPVDLKDKHAIREMLRRVHLGKVDKLTVQDTLACLGEDLRTGTGAAADLSRYIDSLLSKGAEQLSSQARDQCMRLVAQYDLLTDYPRVSSMRDRFYDALLQLVLDGPLTYERYLRLLDCLKTPMQQNAALLQALDRRRAEPADPTWLLVRRGIGDTDDDLINALAQNSVPATRLATRLVDDAVRATGSAGAGDFNSGEPTLRPEHGRLIFDPAVQYMTRYSNRDRAEFIRLGYLAPALDRYFAGDQPAQVKRAKWILRNVYGNRLSKRNIKEVLGGSPYPPTDALLAAVIQLAEAHAEFAMTEYGRARSANLVPSRRKRRFRSRLQVDPAVSYAKAIVLAVGLIVIVVMVMLVYLSHLF